MGGRNISMLVTLCVTFIGAPQPPSFPLPIFHRKENEDECKNREPNEK